MCAFLYCRVIVYDEPLPDYNAFVVVLYQWNYEVFLPFHYYYVTKQPGSITWLCGMCVAPRIICGHMLRVMNKL